MPSIRVLKSPYPRGTLNQIKGIAVTMTILDEKMQKTHQPVMCKDYIQDAFWSIKTNQSITQYGFNYTPERNNPDAERYQIAFKFKDKISAQTLNNSVKLINNTAKLLSIPETTKCKATTIASQKVLDFPSKWAEKPYGISLLTLLARIGTIYSDKETPTKFLENQKSDNDYVVKPNSNLLFNGDSTTIGLAIKKITKYIISGNLNTAKTYKQYKTPYEVHEKAGVVGSRNDKDGE